MKGTTKMRKYQVTMYTFKEGDKLYYLDKDEIKSSRSQKSTYTNLTLKKS